MVEYFKLSLISFFVCFHVCFSILAKSKDQIFNRSSTTSLMKGEDYKLIQKNPECILTPAMDKITEFKRICDLLCQNTKEIRELCERWNLLLDMYLQGTVMPENEINPFAGRPKKKIHNVSLDHKTIINYYRTNDDTLRVKELDFSSANDFEFKASDLSTEQAKKILNLPDTQSSRKAIFVAKALKQQLCDLEEIANEKCEVFAEREATLRILRDKKILLSTRIEQLNSKIPQNQLEENKT